MHGWKLADEFAVPARATETVGKYNFTVVAGRPFGYPVRMDALFTSLPAVITVSYREVGAAAWKPLPQAALSSHVEPNEQKRQDLQRSLSRGWNTWHRASATAHVDSGTPSPPLGHAPLSSLSAESGARRPLSISVRSPCDLRAISV